MSARRFCRTETTSTPGNGPGSCWPRWGWPTGKPTCRPSSPADSSSGSPSPAHWSPSGLLLADEPTGNLDSRTGGEVIDLLLGLRAEHGLTLLMATHDAALAERCDRRIRLVDGRIVADSLTSDAAAAP